MGLLRRPRIGHKSPFSELVIVDGTHWWTYDPSSGAEANFGDPTATVWLGPAPYLFDPAGFLGALDLDLVGDDEVADRPAFRFRGRKRTSLRRVGTADLVVVASFADSYDLWFDAATGVCLRAISILDERPIMVAEITRIDFALVTKPDLFVFTTRRPTWKFRRSPSRVERRAGSEPTDADDSAAQSADDEGHGHQ